MNINLLVDAVDVTESLEHVNAVLSEGWIFLDMKISPFDGSYIYILGRPKGLKLNDGI